MKRIVVGFIRDFVDPTNLRLRIKGFNNSRLAYSAVNQNGTFFEFSTDDYEKSVSTTH